MAARKLIALDEDDLAVISAHVQDARVRTGNILWRQGEKRLVIGLERLDLDQELDGKQPGHLVSALRFDRVLSVKSRNVAADKPDAAIELIGLEFTETSAPSGKVTLLFSDRGAMQIEVECLECELADLGECEG
jgi:Protein of unknown function (DUF2948)